MEPIVVSCRCGKRLKLPSTVVPGKKVRCPNCSEVLVVPEPEEYDYESAPAPVTAPMGPSAAASSTKTCEYCGETILKSAKKCKHCGEFLGEPDDLPAQAAASMRPLPSRRGAPAPSTAAEMDDPNPAEYFTAIVLAPVGLLIGGIWMAKKLPKAKKMLQVAGASCVIFLAAGYIVWAYVLREEAGGPAAPNVAQGAPPRVFFVPGADDDGDPPQPPPGSNPNPNQNQNANRRNALPGGDIDLDGQPPIIQKAMKANVLIEFEQGKGSGVVLQREGDEVLILTNHHVVDMTFARSQGRQATAIPDLPKPKVNYFDGQSNPGTVTWLAPDGIDLALVKARAPQGVQPVAWQALPKLLAGQEVFAIGNPVGLGWTYTKGVISAIRKDRFPKDDPKRDVPIIQTDTSITYGNSGGGLYAADGELIGINSAIVNPMLGKGLGFAIRMNVLLELKPDGLKLPATAGP